MNSGVLMSGSTLALWGTPRWVFETFSSLIDLMRARTESASVDVSLICRFRFRVWCRFSGHISERRFHLPHESSEPQQPEQRAPRPYMPLKQRPAVPLE